MQQCHRSELAQRQKGLTPLNHGVCSTKSMKSEYCHLVPDQCWKGPTPWSRGGSSARTMKEERRNLGLCQCRKDLTPWSH
mmetsp:Transcript_41905/g.105343  ORF Transcript_41905/g.105343 Transcript_41905/m.105343 type:complete len:80 (+) Transcript_41905:344-583(+)